MSVPADLQAAVARFGPVDQWTPRGEGVSVSLLLALGLLFFQVQTAPVQVPSPAAAPQCVYQAGGFLPDPTCTPGAADPRVSQDNIATTICVPGYTATIRPPTSYTTPLKRRQMAMYGVADQPSRAYEEDHLLPLELGGDPRDPLNLWPQLGASPNQKDQVENAGRAAVCAGTLDLDHAQWMMMHDWRALGVLLGVLDVATP